LKTYRKIATLGLAVVFLLSVIGVSSFHHVCMMQEQAMSSMMAQNETCPSETSHDCCSNKQHKQEKKSKKDCCKTEVQIFKVSNNFSLNAPVKVSFSQNLFLPLRRVFVQFVHAVETEATNSSTTLATSSDFVQIGKTYRQHLRVWRI